MSLLFLFFFSAKWLPRCKNSTISWLVVHGRMPKDVVQANCGRWFVSSGRGKMAHGLVVAMGRLVVMAMDRTVMKNI